MTESIAKRIVEGLDGVLAQKPRLGASLAASVYEWIKDMPNFASEKSRERVELALKRKLDKKLL